MGDYIATAVVVIVIIAAMQVASFFVPAYIIPAPLTILQAFVASLITDYPQILITLARLLATLMISIALGTAIGIITGTIAWIRPYLRALVIIDTGIPALSWMLVAVFWFKNPGGAPVLHHDRHRGSDLCAQYP